MKVNQLKVEALLRECGAQPHNKGYKYIRSAVVRIAADPEKLTAITKELYPEIAEEFSTTPSRVERDMRYCIQVMWDSGKLDEAFQFRPSNTRFLAALVSQLREEAMPELKHSTVLNPNEDIVLGHLGAEVGELVDRYG